MLVNNAPYPTREETPFWTLFSVLFSIPDSHTCFSDPFPRKISCMDPSDLNHGRGTSTPQLLCLRLSDIFKCTFAWSNKIQWVYRLVPRKQFQSRGCHRWGVPYIWLLSSPIQHFSPLLTRYRRHQQKSWWNYYLPSPSSLFLELSIALVSHKTYHSSDRICEWVQFWWYPGIHVNKCW